MPLAPRFASSHMEGLALQVRRAPEAVRLRQLQAAEDLVWEIEEDGLFPLDYVTYRVTGYRGEDADPPMLPGSSLLCDLVALVAMVSRSLAIPADGMLDLDGVARRLRVSPRTVSRLRRRGLPMRWVVDGDRRRLGCSEALVDRFRSRWRGHARAAGFSRMDEAQRRALIVSALAEADTGRSMYEVARLLARRSGRGVETVRGILLADPSVVATLGDRGPLTRQDARVIERALRRGIPWSTLLPRYGCTRGGARRALLRLRADRLHGWPIDQVALEVFARPDAGGILLSSPHAVDCPPPVPRALLEELLIEQSPLPEADETAIVAAMHFLRWRAAAAVGELPYGPSAADLDRIETDLRWAFALQQRLVGACLGVAGAVATQHLQQSIYDLPGRRASSLVRELIDLVGQAVSALDPSRGQRLAGVVRQAVDRHLSRSPRRRRARRAVPRGAAAPALLRPFHSITPWSSLVPGRDLPAATDDEAVRACVELRYGWRGRPRTMDEVAEETGRSMQWLARRLGRLAP